MSASTRSWSVFDIASIQKEITALEKRSVAAGFWQNGEQAQKVMRKLTGLRQDVATWQGLSRRSEELGDLLELAQTEDDQSLGEELATEVEALSRELDELEFRLLLNGPHDAKDSILSIYAGA
ncbi:MAG TPA: PCRF domain-containing protein, partial [Anaerolineae bacterium]|nr:PCRF domain-containing protein [Anaerolineae bacterium]